MSAPRYHRQDRPSPTLLMTVVADAYVIYAPPAFPDRWAKPQGPAWQVRLWRSLTRLVTAGTGARRRCE
ncbi:hypothetical protein ABH925_007242 [Streptacidiphilus sp. EB129]